ncbi:MAG: TolC family protein [Acidobacteria bacterium]|nr:TolC family protein [Acidobacteriota bacterium]
MLKFAVLFAVLFLPTMVLGQSGTNAPAETLSLQQAVDLALRHNRLVNHEKLEVEKAADRLAAVATRRLPGFDVSLSQFQWIKPPEFRFNKGVFGTFPGLGPVPPVNTEITSSHGPSAIIFARATQPLTQLHRIGLGVRMSEAGRDVAESKLQLKQREVAHQVKRGYYAILQMQSALEASEGTLKLYRELDRVVGEYVVQQVALASESLDIKTQLAKEEYEAIRAGNNMAASKELLNYLMGRDIRAEFSVDPISAGTVYEVELSRAQSRALAERPEIKEAQLKQKLAEYDYRLKKSEAIPEVSLTLSYFSAFGVSVLPQNATGVGFTLNWEPFDWGRRRHEMAEKRKTIEQAQEGLREAEALILREVSDRYRKLQEARALLRVSQLHQESTREKLRVATNKYAQEVALYKDVLQSQAGLAEAQDRYQQSLLAFWTARADFEKAIGEL